MNSVSARFQRLWRPLAAAPFFLIGAVACDQTVSTPSTSCSTGVAQIGIGDGYQEILCGCQETAGTILVAGNALTCTVSAGTTVLFVYIEGRQTRQIIPSTAGAFNDSPVCDPGSPTPVHVHQVPFSTPGGYGYQDRFLSTLSGTITVI